MLMNFVVAAAAGRVLDQPSFFSFSINLQVPMNFVLGDVHILRHLSKEVVG